jgi:DNA-binding NarL/FixJ family response regulator
MRRASRLEPRTSDERVERGSNALETRGMDRMSLKTHRVQIIEGHPAVGRGLEALIGLMPGMTVVGLTRRPTRGLQQALDTLPDVALVDADLPGTWSFALIQRLRWRLPKTRIVALGFHPDQKRAAVEAGADAFVLKDAGYEALRAAIAAEDGGAEQPRDEGYRAADRSVDQERVAP